MWEPLLFQAGPVLNPDLLWIRTCFGSGPVLDPGMEIKGMEWKRKEKLRTLPRPVSPALLQQEQSSIQERRY